MNTHGVPDTMYEIQSLAYDLLPACIVSTTWPTVPVPPSLTLAAFATAGYVTDGLSRPYVTQDAHTLTLTGGDGTYWAALSQDTWTTYATWNRQAGTHMVWKLSATRPPDVDGLLVFVQMTVSGGAITAVAPASGVTRAEALRALSGLGTMAQQDAHNVAITGGTAAGLTSLSVTGQATAQVVSVLDRAGSPVSAFEGSVTAGNGRFNLYLPGTADNYLLGRTGVGAQPRSDSNMTIVYDRATRNGLTVQPTADTGGTVALQFLNAAGGFVGSIATTGSGTAFNTSSDVRLKHAVAALAGALDAVRALRPVNFKWNSTDESDIGFLAHELMVQVPTAVTGMPDELNPDGTIRPQQVDQSKIVPILTAALKELLAQVETLTARVSSLETQLGL